MEKNPWDEIAGEVAGEAPEEVGVEERSGIEPSEPITVVVMVKPSDDQVVKALQEQVLGLRHYATTRSIQSTEDIQKATDDLSLMAKLKKAVKEKMDEYLAPLNTHVKEVKSAFALLLGPLEEADTTTRSKILAYKAEQDRLRQEQEEINRLKAEAAEKEAALAEGTGEKPEAPELIEVAAPAPKKVYSEVGASTTIMVRKWEVVDKSQVPDEYKTIDVGRVTRVVKAGIPSIPGIRIWEEPTLRVDSKR